jgi:hypothetical protein
VIKPKILFIPQKNRTKNNTAKIRFAKKVLLLRNAKNLFIPSKLNDWIAIRAVGHHLLKKKAFRSFFLTNGDEERRIKSHEQFMIFFL